MPTDELRIPFAQAIVKDVCNLLGCSLREPWVSQADKIVNLHLSEMDYDPLPTFVEKRIVLIARAALSALGVTVHDTSLFQRVCDCVAPHAEAYSALVSERTRVVTALRTAAQTGADDEDTRKTIECARLIVRGVYQALPNERAARVQKGVFEPAVAEVISHLRRNPKNGLARKYLTRTIALAVLAKILPDGGPNILEGRSIDFTAAVFDAVAQHLHKYLAEVYPSLSFESVTRLEAKTRTAREARLQREAQIGEALTEPPPAPVVVKHECPCCRLEISYNASADVWHCPNCSWSKRQLVEPPPGPKFKIGDWVIVRKDIEGKEHPDPAQRLNPAQVMHFRWSVNQMEWHYKILREGLKKHEIGAYAGESQLILDPHRQAAAKMFGKPAEHVTPEERQTAKLKAFKDAYTPIPKGEFYKMQPGEKSKFIEMREKHIRSVVDGVIPRQIR